jgi:hypothetical protein
MEKNTHQLQLVFEKGYYKFYINPCSCTISGTYKGGDIPYFEDYLDNYDYDNLFKPPNPIDQEWIGNADLPIDVKMIQYCKELIATIDTDFERDHARLKDELGYDPDCDPMQDHWDHESDKIAIQKEFHDNETS